MGIGKNKLGYISAVVNAPYVRLLAKGSCYLLLQLGIGSYNSFSLFVRVKYRHPQLFKHSRYGTLTAAYTPCESYHFHRLRIKKSTVFSW